MPKQKKSAIDKEMKVRFVIRLTHLHIYKFDCHTALGFVGLEGLIGLKLNASAPTRSGCLR